MFLSPRAENEKALRARFYPKGLLKKSGTSRTYVHAGHPMTRSSLLTSVRPLGWDMQSRLREGSPWSSKIPTVILLTSENIEQKLDVDAHVSGGRVGLGGLSTHVVACGYIPGNGEAALL